MPTLPELQELLFAAIATSPGTSAADPLLLDCIAACGTTEPESRLQVYVDAYWLRLREVLAEDFPRTASVLPCETFDAVARDYLTANPSRHPSLRHLGDAFPAFVAARRDVPPWLGDLALLERTRTNVFDSDDDEPWSTDALRRIAPQRWPSLRLGTIRAFRLVELDWTVHELWKDDAVTPRAERVVLRVWRDTEFRVLHAALEPRAAAALRHVVARAPFETLCSAFEGLAPDEAAREIASLLTRWADDGVLVSPRDR